MKYIIASLGIIFFGLGCASPPKTQSEFVGWAREHLDHQNFKVAADYDSVKQKMTVYASQCLGVNVNHSGSGNYANRYRPTLAMVDNKLSLFLDMSMSGTFNDTDPQYIFVAQLWKTSDGQAEGTTYYREATFGVDTSKVSKRLIQWVNGEKKMCPDLH